MKTTAAKFVSAIFASIVASSTLMAAPDNEEKTGDNCLLGPSASTPPGGHWYYRVDRVNKRNCWYMRLEKDKVARKPAVESTARAEQAAAPSPQKPPQRSISDARAELTPSQAPLEQDARTVATQRIPTVAADALRSDDTPRSDVSDSSLLSSSVASRWPDSLAAAASPAVPPPVPAVPTPAPATRVAETQPQAAPAALPPRPAAAAAPAANAGSETAALSPPMLLTVLIGALSVIAVIGSAIFGRGNRRSIRLSPSAPMPPVDFAEPQRAPDDPRRRIEQMLAHINHRAAA